MTEKKQRYYFYTIKHTPSQWEYINSTVSTLGLTEFVKQSVTEMKNKPENRDPRIHVLFQQEITEKEFNELCDLHY